MAHHGHLRHSHRSRIIKIKPESETNDGDNAELDRGSSNLLEIVDPIKNPILTSPDILSEDACDPLQNATCPDEEHDTTEDTLSKRQPAESPQSTLVEPIVQIIGPNSETHGVSTAQESPMTTSNPLVGAVPAPGSTTAETIAVSVPAISLPTLPTNLLPTQPTVSPTPTLLPTRPTAAISSPKVLVGSSSTRSTSTPLVTSTSLYVSQTSTSSAFHAEITSTSSSSGSATTSTTDNSYSTFPSTPAGPEVPGTSIGTGSGNVPPTTGSQPTSGSGSPTEASTPKIVGGVIGSVAGLAMIFLLLYYLLRRRKFLQSMGIQALPSDDAGPREMAERSASNDSLFAATYLAPAFIKRWRNSTMTTKTEDTLSSSNPSERGFQKISGRKIPPVLIQGGDGYGGGFEGDSPTIPGYPPVSPGGGPLSSQPSYGPPPSSPYGVPLDPNYPREIDEFTTPTRPKAVHLPISSSVNFGSPQTVTPSRPVVQPQSAVPVGSPSRSGLGRSPPSYDGNRGSRFTEGLDL